MPMPLKETDPKTYAGQVGAAIRAARRKKKLSVPAVAAAAGCPVQTWYSWEHGKIDLDRLPAIAAALRTKPAKLLP